MHEIHIEQEEIALKHKIEEATERFVAELTTIGKDYGELYKKKCYISDSNAIDQRKLQALHGIFQASFLNEVVFNLDIMPAIILTIDDLKPHCCNFPAQMTRRSKEEKNGLSAPCKRRLGKTDLYFCTLGTHRAYARKLDLPATIAEAEAKGIKVPPKTVDTRQPHIRFKTTRKTSSDDAGPVLEKHVVLRQPIKDMSTIATATTVITPKAKKQKIQHTIRQEIPRYQCVHQCPVTREEMR